MPPKGAGKQLAEVVGYEDNSLLCVFPQSDPTDKQWAVDPTWVTLCEDKGADPAKLAVDTNYVCLKNSNQALFARPCKSEEQLGYLGLGYEGGSLPHYQLQRPLFHEGS